MATFFTLSVLAFNIIPSLSIVPNCDSITILCPGPDPACCKGSCCQFLHQYQTAPSIKIPPNLNPNPIQIPDIIQQNINHNNDPRIITNSNPIPGGFHTDNIHTMMGKPLPSLNDECSTRFGIQFQCAAGLKCKFTGQNNIDLYLLGDCKVKHLETGCNVDSDCYKFNDKCINGRCTNQVIFTPPQPPQPMPGHDNNMNGVSFARGAVSDNLDEQRTEIKGGRRNIPFNLSKQAQLIIGVLALLCALGACYKCCSVFYKLREGRRQKKGSNGSSIYQSGTRSDITAVDADVEWSDNSESVNDNDKGKDAENLLNIPVDNDREEDDAKSPYADYTDNDLL